MKTTIVKRTLFGCIAFVCAGCTTNIYLCKCEPAAEAAQQNTTGPASSSTFATGAAAADPSSETPFSRSQPSAQSTTITFINRLPQAVTVYWRDFDGVEKIYMNLGPGQSYDQQTYTTHVWVVRDSASQAVVFSIVGKEEKQIAEIGKR